MQHQPRINTWILDEKERAMPVVIKETHDGNQHSYKIEYKRDQIGSISFKSEKETVSILNINEDGAAKYKLSNVSKALLECALKNYLPNKDLKVHFLSNSILSDRQFVELKPLHNQYSEEFRKAISDYNAHRTNANKKIVKGYDDFNKLKEDATSYLNKDAKDTTFADSIRYYHDTENVSSYLEKDVIEKLSKEYRLGKFTPIGSGLNYGDLIWYVNSCSGIKDKRLLKLLKPGEIDPANAIEINVKWPGLTDQQKGLMLSPNALELMNRNYVSGWYMAVYLRNSYYDDADLKKVLSDEFIKEHFEIGGHHIDDYIA